MIPRSVGSNDQETVGDAGPLDAASFETVFRAHYGSLCSFALRYTGDVAAAEELVQDLFTKLWIDPDAWPAPRNERAYLFAAVRNRALNARARQQLEHDWVDEERMSETPESPAPDALAVVEASELQRQLDAAIEALPERCRLVIHLRWREQLSYAEIASVMGISVKGVENQLARGLARLRDLLPNG